MRVRSPDGLGVYSGVCVCSVKSTTREIDSIIKWLIDNVADSRWRCSDVYQADPSSMLAVEFDSYSDSRRFVKQFWTELNKV